MTDAPTPKQALLLWCLLGRGGSALQGDLAPGVDRADREALVAQRLIEAPKQGHSFRLSVTDRGWDWAGKHLRAPLPPTFRVLQDWLERLEADLARSGRTLADLIGSPGEEAPPPPKPARRTPAGARAKPSRKSSKAAGAAPSTVAARNGQGGAKAPRRTTATPRKPTAKQVRARIEDAYLKLTKGEKAKAVRLSALRDELRDVDRATLDTGLAAILRGDPTARLSQFSDPKSLDEAERAAAFSPAGEPFHIIRIQS